MSHKASQDNTIEVKYEERWKKNEKQQRENSWERKKWYATNTTWKKRGWEELLEAASGHYETERKTGGGKTDSINRQRQIPIQPWNGPACTQLQTFKNVGQTKCLLLVLYKWGYIRAKKNHIICTYIHNLLIKVLKVLTLTALIRPPPPILVTSPFYSKK